MKVTATLLRPNLYYKVPLMDEVKVTPCRTWPEITMFDLLPFPALLHSLTSLNKLLALESFPQGLLLENPTHNKIQDREGEGR